MQEFFKTETIQERVLLIGVRTGEADDTDGSAWCATMSFPRCSCGSWKTNYR